jgi:hypothetical protein
MARYFDKGRNPRISDRALPVIPTASFAGGREKRAVTANRAHFVVRNWCLQEQRK